MSNKAWHISYLSAIVGPCTATTDDGCMAWADGSFDGFILRLLDKDNNGGELLLVIQPEMDEIQMFTLVGYCTANSLNYIIKDWDDLCDEGKEEAKKTRH